MGRHRIFAGCPAPARIAEQMEAWAIQNLPGARVLPAASLHATLFFFGWRSDEEVALLLDAFHMAEWKPLAVQATGIKRFGRTAISFVLSADVEDLFASDGFVRLSEMAGEGGKFRKLHLTAARSKETKNLPRNAPAYSFIFDRFCLYESVLGKGVPDYRVLASSGK
jgi:2'-5' RNA ligase